MVHLTISGKAAHENAILYPPVRPRLYRLDSRFGLLCISRSFRSRDYEPALLDQLLHLASSERSPLHRYSHTTSRPTHRMGVRNAPARYSWHDWRGSRSLSFIDIHATDSRLIGRPLRRFSICYICACAWDRGGDHVEGNPVTALAELKTTTQRIASYRATGYPEITNPQIQTKILLPRSCRAILSRLHSSHAPTSSAPPRSPPAPSLRHILPPA